MSNKTRSLILAAIAGATLVINALPASAAIRGGGHGGGGRPNGGHFVSHGGGFVHQAFRNPRGGVSHFPGRGPGRPRGPVYGWHHHHHFPVYGGPIIPVAVATTPIVTDTAIPAPAPVASCAIPAGSYVTITFMPTVTAADITNFLQSYNVTLADGPDKDGVYKVRLAGQALPANRIAEVVSSMRSQATIVKAVEG